jgi:hypothetical protein
MFTTTMLHPPVPPYSEVVTLVESHAAHHKLDIQTPPQMVFYGQHFNKNKKGNGSHSFNSRGRGFVQGNSSVSKPTSSQIGQHQGGPSPKPNNDEKLVCQICNKRNHTALKCFNRFNHSFTPEDVPQALAAMKIVDTQDGDWFPDIGDTDHITSNPGNLHSLTPYNGHDGVMVGN